MMKMKIGTKSLLFGAHCLLIHPLFVALAWWRLFGFPWSLRLWVAFYVHDLGYWNSPNMDGPAGENHVEVGARIMGRLFGAQWALFCLYHSRFRALRDDKPISRLCLADKLSIVLEPTWLYLPRVRLSKEITEYMEACENRPSAPGKYAEMRITNKNERAWIQDVKKYLLNWVKTFSSREFYTGDGDG